MGAGVTQMHRPLPHGRPPPHRFRHEPQFVLSVRRSVSQPSSRCMLQSPRPAGQAVTHAEPTQYLPAAHGAPHAPQWLADVAVSVSQPLAGLPSQSPTHA